MKSPARKARPRPSGGELAAEERIVEAALNSFASHGFDGVSTTEIAAQAGISQPMVHYHFSTKDALWRAAVDRLFTRIFETFPIDRNELRDLDAATKLKIVMRRFVFISARYPALGQIVVHEGSRGGTRLQWLVKRHFKAHYETFDRLIEAAQAEGRMKPIPNWIVTMVITNAAATMFNFEPLIKATWNQEVFTPEAVEIQANAVIEILFHGLLTDRKTGGDQ